MVDKEAMVVGETPNPPTTAGDKSSSTEQSVWELFLQVAKRKPIITSLAGLYFGTATATLFGLPVWGAWEFLLVVTLIAAIVGILVPYFRPKSKASAMNNANQDGTAQQAKVSNKGFWHSWWPLLGVFAVIKLIEPWVKEDDPNGFKPHIAPQVNSRPYNDANRLLRRRDPQADFLFNARARNTNNYWQVTVAALHALRFLDPADSNESAAAFDQRFLNGFESALQTAQGVSPTGVDADLVALTQTHLQMDAQLVKLTRQVQQLNKDRGHVPGNESLRERRAQEDQWWDKLANLTEEDIADMPEQIQQLIILMRQLPETREQQFREIEIMQARLKERYRTQSFSLPEIASESE